MAESDKYPTFKWLIGVMLSTLAIAMGFMQMQQNSFNTQLDKKVDKEVYNTMCTDLVEIKTIAAETQKSLHKLEVQMAQVQNELERRNRKISLIERELQYIPRDVVDVNRLTRHELRIIP